jgi:large subunit ribosomal protein L3
VQEKRREKGKESIIMAKGHKPVKGSRAYWPKKRAKNIYSVPRTHPETKEAKPLDFAAYKAGMTQVSYVDNTKNSPTQGQEIFVPVTVLDSPPLVVCGIKFYKKTVHGRVDMGLVWMENIPKDLVRKTFLPKKPAKKIDDINMEKVAEVRLLVHTKPKESTIGKKRPELFEFPLGGDVSQAVDYAKGKLGGEIKAEDVFAPGEWIDVKSVSKGKGFQGVVKRFGVVVRGRKAKMKRRHIGVLAPRGVARVLPGAVAMAGQMGFQTRTEYNKQILKIGNDGLTPKGGWLKYGELKGNYIILAGSIPGPKKRLIMLRKGMRAPQPQQVDIKHTVLESQQ